MRDRFTAFSIIVSACLLTSAALGQPTLHKSIKGAKRIIFLGDSITDAGHYIAMLDAQFKTQLPTQKIELINLGLPSEGCTGLSEPDHPFPRPNVHERLERALAKTKPDVVVACYGMNDGIYYPLSKDRFEKYKQGMKALIEKVKGANVRLVILTPPAFDPQPFKKRGKLLPKEAEKYAWFAIYEGYADVIKAYADWVLQLEKPVDQVIDIHTPVVKFLAQKRKKDADFEASSDGVHMNAVGHSVLAKAITKAWGLDPNVVPDPKLLASLERKHKILHAAWLSEVGHKRPGVKPGLPLKEALKKAKAFDTSLNNWRKNLPATRVVIGNWLAQEGGANAKTPLVGPFGVAFDSKQRMIIVELQGGRVHRFDSMFGLEHLGGDGSKRHVGDGGPAQKAAFNGMHNVAVTSDDTIYVADTWNHCIRRIEPNTNVISTFAGTGKAGFSGDGGPADKAEFNFVMCISLTANEDALLVADLRNRRIRRVDLKTKIVTTIAGNGKRGIPENGSKANESPLVDPRAVAGDRDGNVYVLERAGNALRRVDTKGAITTVAGLKQIGFRDGDASQAQFASPKHLAVDSQNRVIIADDMNRAIRRYDPESKTVITLIGHGRSRPPVYLSRPHGVCIHEGKLYVVDTGNNRILQVQEVE